LRARKNRERDTRLHFRCPGVMPGALNAGGRGRTGSWRQLCVSIALYSPVLPAPLRSAGLVPGLCRALSRCTYGRERERDKGHRAWDASSLSRLLRGCISHLRANDPWNQRNLADGRSCESRSAATRSEA
jgi:hypothetical protein